ncbi:MAG: hypothetical protein Q7P63_01435 [Verrucomicrobiota bacterium JB022]|nr:hypothetical protein [Verrucomicrobiota bacterium JB022]
MSHLTKPPVLFLIFNRPEPTARVFERLREIQPTQLYIAADGPRAQKAGEAELCAQTRAIVANIDWPCECKTLFREENLGCRDAVSSAITWFFEQVDEGIILEDDCLPEPSFFPFCSELLARYRYDKRVATIGGYGEISRQAFGEASYGFSLYNIPWGWATWKRAWAYYEGTPPDFETLMDSTWLQDLHGSPEVAEYWRTQFRRISIWDFLYRLSIWRNGGLCIIPAVNLISNIGFGADATHTQNAGAANDSRPTEPITFPLRHPAYVSRNYEIDRELNRTRFHVKPKITPRPISKRMERFDPIAHKLARKLRKFIR